MEDSTVTPLPTESFYFDVSGEVQLGSNRGNYLFQNPKVEMEWTGGIGGVSYEDDGGLGVGGGVGGGFGVGGGGGMDQNRLPIDTPLDVRIQVESWGPEEKELDITAWGVSLISPVYSFFRNLVERFAPSSQYPQI